MKKIIILSLLFLFLGFVPKLFAQTVAELEAKLENASNAEKGAILAKLAYTLRKSNPNKSLEYADKAIEQGKSTGNKNDELSGYLYGGIALTSLNSFSKAADYFGNALQVADETGSKNGLNAILTNTGYCNYRAGKYDKAIKAYSRLLEFLGNVNTAEFAAAANFLGESYRGKGDCDKAMESYTKAQKAAEAINDKPAMANTYENLGLAFSCKKNWLKAIEWTKKAQTIHEGTGNKEGMVICYQSLGYYYQGYGDFTSALDNLNKGLTTAKNSGLNNLAQELNRDIETVTKNKEKKTSAVTDLEKNQKQQDLEKIKTIENIAEQYQRENINKEYALKEKEQLIGQKEEIISIKGAESKVDKEKISTLHQEKKKTEAELIQEQEQVKRQQQFIYFAIAVLIIVIIFSLLLWKQFSLKKKAYNQLFEQNEEIKKQKHQIEIQAAELAKLSIVASKTTNVVMIMNADADFEWTNDSFTRLYGYDLETMRQNNLGNLKAFSGRKDIDDILNLCVGDKKTISYETPTKTSQGNKIWTQTSLTPVLNEINEVVKIVAIDTDITEIKNAEEEIRAKNNELEEKNLLITDSINYAKTIQEAILPSSKYIATKFSDYFLFYKPRDIVSGDFYWVGELQGKIYIAVADCTGHGVPGGFMSMIGNTLLNAIIYEMKISSPADILNELNSKVIKGLNKGSDIVTHQEDGMDITVCCIDRGKNEIEIALANHSAYMMYGDECKEIEGDIYSIGEILTQRLEQAFTSTKYTYTPGSVLFMFSDGFKDQFGGPEFRKFSSDRFQALLFENRMKPMKEIPQKLQEALDAWKKDEQQVDDILVAGIRL